MTIPFPMEFPPADPIIFRRPLPTPEELRAQLLAAAERGDEKAGWFLLTFVPWARRIC